MRWFSGILLLLALGGCAGMDAGECRVADWRAIGYEDGAKGRGPAYFGERRKDCADHGIAANFGAWSAGRAQGLAEFCKPHNGYRLGTRGYRYSGVCPARLEPAFVAAHADGYGLYERRSALNRIEKRLRRSRKRAAQIEYDITNSTARLVAPRTSPRERARLAVDLKQLAEEKVELEHELHALEQDRARAEFEYRRYRNQIASGGRY